MSTSRTREKADKLTFTQAEVTAKDTAARAGRKNWIINGGFDVWQRGTTGAQPNSGFVADRWKGNNYITGTLTFSQRTDATGQTFRTYGRLAQSSAGSNNSTQGIMQYIEGLHLVGKTVTVSFKVRGNAALSGCKVRGIIAQQTFNLTTDWVKHSFTGTAIQDGSNTRLMFDWGLENTTWHVDIAEVQVEVGSVATDFEHRSYGEELRLCERYYQKLVGAYTQFSQIFNGHYNGTSQIQGAYTYRTEMRNAPSLSYTSTSSNNSSSAYAAAAGGAEVDFIDTLFLYNPSNLSTLIYTGTSTSGTAGHGANVYIQTTITKLALVAEL